MSGRNWKVRYGWPYMEGKRNHLPLWYQAKTNDREEDSMSQRSRAHIGYSDLLSRPSIEINTIWEPLIKKAWKKLQKKTWWRYNVYHHHHHIRAASTDIPGPLSPLLPIIHRLWQFFRATSSHSCWMYVRAGHPAFAWPYVGVHRSTSLMNLSLLLQQCLACLVRLTWMGGRRPYSWCLVGCFRQDLFNIACSILV